LVDYGAVPAMNRPVSMNPLSNRTCGFPAYGLPMVLLTWHAQRKQAAGSQVHADSSLPARAFPVASRCSPRLAHAHSGPGGVVVLLRGGFGPLRPCPHTYLPVHTTKVESLPSSAFGCTPSSVLRTPRTPSRLRSLSAIRPYTRDLCPTQAAGEGLSCSGFFCGNVPPPETPGRSILVPIPEGCLLPSP
jgi:hypothetical protein